MAVIMAIFAVWYVEQLEDRKRGGIIEADPRTSHAASSCLERENDEIELRI